MLSAPARRTKRPRNRVHDRAQGRAEDRAGVGLAWLVRLRWGAVAGQLVTIAVARVVLGLELPLGWVLALVGATAASNLLLALRPPRRPAALVCGVVLGIDTLVLTGLLLGTGGPLNPFSVLYLVHIALAAVVLGARWTLALSALAIACYALLFLAAPAASGPGVHAHGEALSLHLRGMLVAFVVAAVLVSYFVVRLSSAIEARDAELEAVRAEAARHAQLASLTTLAAGAAHELGTPLGTIAIASRELERALDRLAAPGNPGLLEDARLIRSEVDRCRAILDRLATDAGAVRGEAPEPIALDELVRDALASLPSEPRARVRVEVPRMPETFSLPRWAVATALASLLRNALDATAEGAKGTAGEVRLLVRGESGRLRFAVCDEGPGMTADVLERAVEPFFTTKPAGRGMGLGLFLARSIAERLGGRLVLESRVGAGTTAVLELPVDARAAAARRAAHGA